MSQNQLHIETVIEPNFGENAYVVSTTVDTGRRISWVIDPSFPPQPGQILAYLAEHDMTVEYVLLTHGHVDHIAGIDAVLRAFPDARLAMAPADQLMLGNADLNLSAPFGLPMTVQSRPHFDLIPGTTLTLGAFVWRILDTSGHSPGGISFYCPEAAAVLTGDALFAGSIGRTDLPGADHAQLIRNIRENLLSLPAETTVYSGHGPATSIANECKSNPFLVD